MNALLLALLVAAGPARAESSDKPSLSSLFSRVSAYLNGPAKRAPRTAAVAAVRGGIPTDQGEDLDQRLLDRARALRDALLRPDATPGDARALQRVYESLAASQYVQALSLVEGGDAKAEAAKSLSDWASERRDPPLPGAVKALMAGPAAGVDDKALVAAGWAGYVRGLSPSGAAVPDAKPGYAVGPDAAKLDEALQSVRDSILQKKLKEPAEARAHVLAGHLLRALAGADLRGRLEAATAKAAAPLPALDEGAAPAPSSAVPFDPSTIYKKDSKSVALILCASSEGSGELGTGSIVDAARRRVLTNAHVVIRDATREPWPVIHVYFKPARMTGDPKQDMQDAVAGKVVAFDRALDLALVEVERLPDGAAAIPLGDPRAVEVGDRVAAIGHPEQGGLWTLTTGVVSTLVANIGGVPGKDVFQTDASINRGNSGGPLLDSSGRLVGVNTSMARKAADGLAITSVNFSIRSDVARRWMAGQGELVAYGGPAAPADVAAAPTPTPTPTAALVAEKPSKPAAKPAAKPITITESKPYDRDAVIAAEIAKMEELGEEMHEAIQKKLGK